MSPTSMRHFLDWIILDNYNLTFHNFPYFRMEWNVKYATIIMMKQIEGQILYHVGIPFVVNVWPGRSSMVKENAQHAANHIKQELF